MRFALLLLAAASLAQVPERARQDREILYELQPPATHAFRITHDYTESRAGTPYYLNIVRTGSKVKDPESIDLDSGEALKWEVISGAELKRRKMTASENVADNAEIVVTHYARPVPDGGGTSVRLLETYEDAVSYSEKDGELVFDRTLGRPRNLVALPAGWRLTGCTIPATVVMLADGRMLLTFINPRSDEIHVVIKARRR